MPCQSLFVISYHVLNSGNIYTGKYLQEMINYRKRKQAITKTAGEFFPSRGFCIMCTTIFQFFNCPAINQGAKEHPGLTDDLKYFKLDPINIITGRDATFVYRMLHSYFFMHFRKNNTDTSAGFLSPVPPQKSGVCLRDILIWALAC